MSSYFVLVPKQYEKGGGLRASLPNMACTAFIFIVAGPESAPGTPERWYISSPAMRQISVSLLPAFCRFFLEGNADHGLTFNANPQSLGLGTVVFLALVQVKPVDAYMYIYCYCTYLRVGVYLHVCIIIYTVKVPSSRLHT